MEYNFEHITGTKITANENNLYKQLLEFKDKKFFLKLYQKNLQITKKGIAKAVGSDNLIMQAINNISELDRVLNIFSKRFREWFALYWPELVHETEKHEALVEIALKHQKRTTTMGGELEKEDVEQILLLGKEILKLIELRQDHEKYLEKLMKQYCPNLLELAGATIGAKLLEIGKGLKRLALLPASTIQLLGAEKALFRHLKTGSRSPKFGVIFNHQLIQKSQKRNRGKMARMLADKLVICCRLDYFKGEFLAPEYRKHLEGKL
jgi:nucleolar protein 56